MMCLSKGVAVVQFGTLPSPPTSFLLPAFRYPVRSRRLCLSDSPFPGSPRKCGLVTCRLLALSLSLGTGSRPAGLYPTWQCACSRRGQDSTGSQSTCRSSMCQATGLGCLQRQAGTDVPWTGSEMCVCARVCERVCARVWFLWRGPLGIALPACMVSWCSPLRNCSAVPKVASSV